MARRNNNKFDLSVDNFMELTMELHYTRPDGEDDISTMNVEVDDEHSISIKISDGLVPETKQQYFLNKKEVRVLHAWLSTVIE